MPRGKSGTKDCAKCGREFSLFGYQSHFEVCKTKEQKEPNKRVACNLVLNKENNLSIARASEKISAWSKLKRKSLSVEHKESLSRARLKFLEANPDKVPYKLNHSSKRSWPEIFFEKALIEAGITGWFPEFCNGIYRYDFAFPEIHLDVEIDGGTHLQDKVKKIDSRRDAWSRSKGWKVLRFTSSQIRTEISEVIDFLKKYI